MTYKRVGKALVNDDGSEFQKYLNRTRILQENQNKISEQENKINSLEQEILAIKTLLLQRDS